MQADDRGNTVLVVVRPRLLQDLLVRLLHARGLPATSDVAAASGHPAVAVVTDDVVIDLGADDVPTVVIGPSGEPLRIRTSAGAAPPAVGSSLAELMAVVADAVHG